MCFLGEEEEKRNSHEEPEDALCVWAAHVLIVHVGRCRKLTFHSRVSVNMTSSMMFLLIGAYRAQY